MAAETKSRFSVSELAVLRAAVAAQGLIVWFPAGFEVRGRLWSNELIRLSHSQDWVLTDAGWDVARELGMLDPPEVGAVGPGVFGTLDALADAVGEQAVLELLAGWANARVRQRPQLVAQVLLTCQAMVGGCRDVMTAGAGLPRVQGHGGAHAV